MSKSKKKKKSSSSKAQYDAKRKNNLAAVSKKTEKQDNKPADEKKKEAFETKAAVDKDVRLTEAEKDEIVAAEESPFPENAASFGSAEETTAETAEELLEKEPENKEGMAENKTAAPAPTPYFDTVLPPAPAVEIPFDPEFTQKDFYKSVKKLRPKDIIMPEETEKKLKKKKQQNLVSNIITFTLLIICLGVAAVCIYMLGENIWGKVKGQKLYSETEFEVFTLEDMGTSSSTGTLTYVTKDVPMLTVFERIEAGESAQIQPPESNQYNQQLEQMKASLSALKAKNSDVYGWIYVEGTNINHPIVRGADNSYYLNHAYTGEYLPIGCIFADMTTEDLITDNYNTVLYGHNVVSTGQSSMFHDVEKFLNREFFDSTNIYIYTMDGAFIFKPVAIYDTVANYQYFKAVFSSEEEFLGFAAEMLTNSRFDTGEVFEKGDRMLTLSTCTNGAQNGRYSLQAKLIEVIK